METSPSLLSLPRSLQGRPTIPSFFCLCLEVLGQKINLVVERGEWKIIKVTQNGPSVSHALFTDDLILFGETSTQQATTIWKES